MDDVTRMTQKNKVICNGETYYHKFIQTQDKDWTEIYDADSNFLFMEKGQLPIRAIGIMLKAYQRGLMIGRFKTMIEVKPRMLKPLFRYRLKRNIRKHRADQTKPKKAVDRSSLMNKLDSVCRKHHGGLPNEPDNCPPWNQD